MRPQQLAFDFTPRETLHEAYAVLYADFAAEHSDQIARMLADHQRMQSDALRLAMLSDEIFEGLPDTVHTFRQSQRARDMMWRRA